MEKFIVLKAQEASRIAGWMKLSAPAGLRQVGDSFTSRFSSLSGVVLLHGSPALDPGDFPFLQGFFMSRGLLVFSADTQQFEDLLICFLETTAFERRKQLHREWQRSALFVNIA
jgi:hypothetical protein